MAGKAQASAIPPEHTGNVKVAKPQTGQEYLDSLRDDRTVYIYGEKVKDVTTHPAFRNTSRMVARLYDALHGDRRDKLLLPTDTGNGGNVAGSSPIGVGDAGAKPFDSSLRVGHAVEHLGFQERVARPAKLLAHMTGDHRAAHGHRQRGAR